MGAAKLGDLLLPVMGRVSMDLVTIDVDGAPELKEGDWVDMDFDLAMGSAFSGMSQYELLTGLPAAASRATGADLALPLPGGGKVFLLMCGGHQCLGIGRAHHVAQCPHDLQHGRWFAHRRTA